jgi:hypothetical protein
MRQGLFFLPLKTWLLAAVFIAAAPSATWTCEAFSVGGSSVGIRHRTTTSTTTTTRLNARKTEPEMTKKKEPKAKIDPALSKPISLFELDLMEQRASKKVMDSLLLPQRLGEVVTFFGWGFLFSFFVLEAFGYTYLPNPNGQGLTIGTLESRDFQMEIRKSSIKEVKQQRQAQEDKQAMFRNSIQ